jgi:hypothetical protein
MKYRQRLSEVEPRIDALSVEADDHKCVKQAKADGRNNEQSHRGNVRRVVPQERSPADVDDPKPGGGEHSYDRGISLTA